MIIGRCHVVQQVVPGPWADNRASPGLATVVNLTGGTARRLVVAERRDRSAAS